MPWCPPASSRAAPRSPAAGISTLPSPAARIGTSGCACWPRGRSSAPPPSWCITARTATTCPITSNAWRMSVCGCTTSFCSDRPLSLSPRPPGRSPGRSGPATPTFSPRSPTCARATPHAARSASRPRRRCGRGCSIRTSSITNWPAAASRAVSAARRRALTSRRAGRASGACWTPICPRSAPIRPGRPGAGPGWPWPNSAQ